MAILYTFPIKSIPVNDDLILISDSAEGNKTKQVKVGDLPGVTGAGVASVTIGHGTSTGVADALKTSAGTGAITLTINKYAGTTNVGYVPEGGSGTTFLRGDGTWVTPTDTNTTYTAGDGLDLTGTEFSTDLKANGGLVIEATELAVDLSASAITGTLAVADGGTGTTTLSSGAFLKGNGTGAVTTAADVNLASEVTGSLGVGNGGTGQSTIGAYSVFVGTGATATERSSSSTSAIQLPAGTTAQAPTGVNGMLRYDTTTNKLMVYENGAWVNVTTAAP